MKKIAAVVLLSAVVAAPAFAADEGFYAGVTLGNGKPGVSPSAAALSKKSEFIYGGLAGYQYNKNLAIEAQFTGLGKAKPCPMWYEPEREFVFPMRYEPEAKNLRRIVKWVDHCKDDDQHERNTALYD